MELSQEIIKMRLPEVLIQPIEGSPKKQQVLFRMESTCKNDTTCVFRVYQDFLKIRHLLIYRWPGIYIPYISPKTKPVFFHTNT